MKKTILAAAGLVVVAGAAIVPIAGVFAESDTISVTVSESCSFTRTTGTGSYTATMQPNSLNESVGSSTYKVICNNSKGYEVSAAFTALGSSITYSATTPTAGSGTWTASLGDSTNLAATGAKLMEASTVTAGDSKTVTYKVGTATAQAIGTYSGTATYTFTQKN